MKKNNNKNLEESFYLSGTKLNFFSFLNILIQIKNNNNILKYNNNSKSNNSNNNNNNIYIYN